MENVGRKVLGSKIKCLKWGLETSELGNGAR